MKCLLSAHYIFLSSVFVCVWELDADLCRRFYSPYEGSCFIEENRRQKWWGEERVVLIRLCKVPSMRIINFLFSPRPDLRPSLCPHTLLSPIPSPLSLILSILFSPFWFLLSLSLKKLKIKYIYTQYIYLFISCVVWLMLLPLNSKLSQNKSHTLVNLFVILYLRIANFRPSL